MGSSLSVEKAVKCIKIQLKVEHLYPPTNFSKLSKGPDLSLRWAHFDSQALCLTPLV